MIVAKLNLKTMPKDCTDNCPMYAEYEDEDFGMSIHKCILGGSSWGCAVERPKDCPLTKVNIPKEKKNTLQIEEKLAQKYNYKPLPQDLSIKYRNFFRENIPSFLHEDGAAQTLYTKQGSPLCANYDRIVIGDYGAFIEFSDTTYAETFIVAPGQEYRINDPKYSKNVKYIWLTIQDDSHIKIYKQKKRVAYADYLPKRYYVSVHEVKI